MGELIALNKLNLHVTTELGPVFEAAGEVAGEWARNLEAQIEQAGLPSARTVEICIVPTEALLALVASGRAFRVQTDFLMPVQEPQP